jgi:hypothetical protein
MKLRRCWEGIGYWRDWATGMREYLYIEQLAELTPWTPQAIRTMMARGVFKRGVHYFKPHGPLSRPIFSWAAVMEYIRSEETLNDEGESAMVRLANGAVIDLDEATAKAHRLLG